MISQYKTEHNSLLKQPKMICDRFCDCFIPNLAIPLRVKPPSVHVISVPVTSGDKHRDKKHSSVEYKQIGQVPSCMKEYQA